MRYVREGIAYHKSICNQLKEGLPFWPLGLASLTDEFLCVGIECETALYLALWCAGESGGTFELPVPAALGRECQVRCAYPEDLPIPAQWEAQKSTLTVAMKGKTARIIELKLFTFGF
jgi:alpha-galactosidase